MKLNFTKMHGLGNDFIIIDNRIKRLKNLSRLSKTLCDRRYGIGADQLLILDNSRKADFRMRIYNSNGSEVEMCGNGIRCLAKYIWDNKLMVRQGLRVSLSRTPHHPEQNRGKNNQLAIETLAGIIRPQKSGNNIKVDMGEPVFEPGKIPVLIGEKTEVKKFRRSGGVSTQLPNLSVSYLQGKAANEKHEPIIDYPLIVGGVTFKITCVSMGNPHAIIVTNDVKKAPLLKYGPMIERHRLFPKRTNVEFIQILNRKSINMRVWERGAGETMACGTGASASVVAANLLGLTDGKVSVRLAGGRMTIEWSAKDNHVYMTGPAVKVFEGTVEI